MSDVQKPGLASNKSEEARRPPAPYAWLWLLVSGAVVEMFGLRWQAMIAGIAFMCHQVGSATGAFGRPEFAAADKGEALFTTAADEVVKFVREFAGWTPIEPG